MVAADPLAQRLAQVIRPAQEGALDPDGELTRERAHELDHAILRKARDQIGRDLPAAWPESLHALRAEVRLDDPAESGVSRGIHAVGHRRVTRYHIAEVDVIQQHAHHVRMAQQRPAQVLAVGDRAAPALFVVGGELIVQHVPAARIPVRVSIAAHGKSPPARARSRPVRQYAPVIGPPRETDRHGRHARVHCLRGTELPTPPSPASELPPKALAIVRPSLRVSPRASGLPARLYQ